MLSQAQLDAFERDGVLIVEDAIPLETRLAVEREYAQLLDRLYNGWVREGRVPNPTKGMGFYDKLSAAYGAGCDYFQPLDISLPGDVIEPDTPMHFGPAILSLITNHGLLDIVQQVLGPEITSNPIQHVRIKPPEKALHADEIRAHVGGTDWHQDRAVAHAEADATRMVTVWCAMNDATVANGCLQAIPGGHRQGMRPHCPQVQTAIADGYLDPNEAVALPVKAGGIVLLHPLTPHASLPNTTDGFRWSFDIRYNVTGEPTGRAHFPSFVARSLAKPETELRDADVWRSMWEDARAQLSRQPHIPIHRWRNDSPACA